MLVVLSGLVLIIVVSVGGLRSQQDKADCSKERRALAVATEQYKADRGTYPADVTTLVKAELLAKGEVTHVRVQAVGTTGVRYVGDRTCPT